MTHRSPGSDDEGRSWWCNVPPGEAWRKAILEHVFKRTAFQDFVVATMMRDSWEPRRDPTKRRAELK